MKRKHLIIFAVVYMAYTAIYVARLNMSMAGPEFTAAGMLTTQQFGMLGSVFSVVFAVGRLINGAASDRVAPGIMISVGLVLVAVSNILIGFFPPFIGILLLWSANGFAQSMLWSSVLCVVSSIYDAQTAKKKTAVMVTSVATGNILGILFNMLLIDRLGLEWAFIVPGAVTLILSGIVVFSLRSIPAPKAAEGRKHASVFQLIKKGEIRVACVPAVLHGTIKDNINFWMPLLFVSRYAIDLKSSALFVLFIPVIGLAGRLIYPLCYRLCKNQEHLVSTYAFACCAVFCVPLLFSATPPIMAAVCLGVIYAAVSVANTSMLSIYPIRFISTGNVASVSGVMDFSTYLGAGIGSLAYGYMVDALGYNSMFISWIFVGVVSVAFALKLMKMTAAEKIAD